MSAIAVNPLDWDDQVNGNGGWSSTAVDYFGRKYRVSYEDKADGDWFWYGAMRFSTAQKAKAAAQADYDRAKREHVAKFVYEAMRKAASEPVPANGPPAWVENGNSDLQGYARAVTDHIFAALTVSAKESSNDQ